MAITDGFDIDPFDALTEHYRNACSDRGNHTNHRTLPYQFAIGIKISDLEARGRTLDSILEQKAENNPEIRGLIDCQTVEGDGEIYDKIARTVTRVNGGRLVLYVFQSQSAPNSPNRPEAVKKYEEMGPITPVEVVNFHHGLNRLDDSADNKRDYRIPIQLTLF